MTVFALLLWVGVELTGNVLINGWNKLGQDPPEGANRIYCFLLRGQILKKSFIFKLTICLFSWQVMLKLLHLKL